MLHVLSGRGGRRWSDNDRHFGPFTFAYSKTYRPIAVILSSGSIDQDSPGCCIRFQALGCTLICELPQMIKPWRRWVDLKYEPAYGIQGYWDEHPREYGFSLSDGYLNVRLGRQTNDSSTEQRWGCFLPWTQWRQVAHRIYNADGSLVGDVARLRVGDEKGWERYKAVTDAAVRAKFAVIDYDGCRIEVEGRIEEREWRLGTGYFRWLGYLVPRKRSRAMNLAFSDEVGPEKGSWKGGMVGHSVEILPGETPDAAMRRYCDMEHSARGRKYRITFAGAA